MFTGIIEEVGRLKDRRKSEESSTITVACQKVLNGTMLGDSIAVNGVCLTVTKIGKDFFVADVMNETFKRSILGQIGIGSEVNLERAMAADGRFGGHILSGHIDGTGTVKGITRDDNAYWYKIEAKKEVLKYIVEKGSVAVNGISLTVAYVDDAGFTVSIIPHTRGETNIKDLKTGSMVNLECDIIGKYVERLLFFKDTTLSFEDTKESGSAGGLTREFLAENGF